MKYSKLDLKKSLSLLIIVMLGTLINAQQIKLKNDNVILGEKNILTYKRSDMGSKFQVYTLKDNEEVLFINLQNTPERQGNYWKFYFPVQDKFFFKKIINSFKDELKLLFQDKVFDEEGTINEAKLDTYIKKYNEL